MIIFLLIVISLYFLLRALMPYLRPYIYRWFIRRAFRQYGAPDMDPFSSQSQKKRKSGKKPNAKDGAPAAPHRHSHSGPIIPKEYAEDVEFVEIHTYSEETKIGDSKVETIIEEQISEAEIIEIRTNSTKKSKP